MNREHDKLDRVIAELDRLAAAIEARDQQWEQAIHEAAKAFNDFDATYEEDGLDGDGFVAACRERVQKGVE